MYRGCDALLLAFVSQIRLLLFPIVLVVVEYCSLAFDRLLSLIADEMVMGVRFPFLELLGITGN